MQMAAVDSMPKIKITKAKGKQPWWTHDLLTAKKDLARRRRLNEHVYDRDAYNRARNCLLKDLRKVKMQAWRCFADDINVNTWGKAFRWAKNGTRRQTIPTSLRRPQGDITSCLNETATLIHDSFFPKKSDESEFSIEGPMRQYDLTIDTERIKAAIWRMKPNRAPGPDGITAKMLRQSWHVLGEDITDLFRRCMDVAVFPKTLKTGRLVVIPKAGKPDRLNPKSYRPVSLLNAL
jgi:hypothetical protein